MSVLDVLDATRLCSRWSDPDPAIWARPVPTANRAAVVARAHSWRSFARNPRAVLLTGLVGADLARDAVTRALAAAR
jgi:hypothetical protein